MARFYAQLCTVVFFVVVVAGLVLGNASPVDQGQAGGNLGSITLHLTWIRDAFDALLLLIFVYVGFFASRQSGKMVMLAAGVVLFAFGIIGFVIGDNDQASKGIAGMNFPALVNIFDTFFGVLGMLAAFGTLDDQAHAQPEQSIIRPGTPAAGTAKKA